MTWTIDTAKLRALADWLDAKYPEDKAKGEDEVQRDLRTWAAEIDALKRDSDAARSRAEKAEAPTLPPLTPARKRVLDAYLDLQDRTGWAPTLREVAAELGLSTTTVFDALRRLRQDGHLPQGRGYRGTKAP